MIFSNQLSALVRGHNEALAGVLMEESTITSWDLLLIVMPSCRRFKSTQEKGGDKKNTKV